MENLSGYTATELLKEINDAKKLHDAIKKEIVDYTYQVDELDKIVNDKISELTAVEKNYVELIEELNNRQNAIR
jgi:hypothetical protein